MPIVYNKNTVLNDFANAVSVGNYQKMPYRLWRAIAAHNSTQCCIAVNDDTDCYLTCFINLGGDGTKTWQFDPHDGSFGSFLLYYVSTKEGDNDTMQVINSTTTNSTIPNYLTATSAPYLHPDTISSNITNQIINNITNNKEKNEMDTSNLFNFDFGSVPSTHFRMSPYGIAVHTQANGWVAFNPKTDELFNVDVLNFDISKLIYKMPVALGAVKPGDILMHGGKPVFVRSINSDGTVSVIDYTNATVSNILPVKSPFGFNFFTKVCTLFNFSKMNASETSPFGNMLPFLLMGDGNIDPMIFLFMENGMDFAQNPMMLYFLAQNGKDKNSDILPFMLMMNGSLSGMGTSSTAAPAAMSTPASV